jgi:hypothetical protein
MAARAWNLRKWMVAVAIFLFWKKVGLFFVKYPRFFPNEQSNPSKNYCVRAHLSEHDNLDIVKVNSRPLKTISKQADNHFD